MTSFLADENIELYLVQALMARLPTVDIIRAQDVGLAATADADILEWAATTGRVVVSHDVSTMRPLAESRVATGRRMPGLVLISEGNTAGRILEFLEDMVLYGRDGEWEGQILFVRPRR